MQFPPITTNISPPGGVTPLPGVQVDLFLEQMRQQTQRSDDTRRREKQELDEQIQRNADKRKSDLQQTRLQMIADSRQTQDRRERLDAIDERKALRRQELDRKELDAKLDHRLDQKHREAEKLLKLQQNQTSEVISESPNMLGIAQQAVKDSENFTPESKPVQVEPQRGDARDVIVNELSVQNTERGGAEYRLKGDSLNSNIREATNTKIVEPVKTDSVETGKQMQMLASFSDLSGKIAAALRPSTPNPPREARPGFANRHSVEEAKPDSVPVNKKPQKMTPEFLATLEAALRSKSRKKEPSESSKDGLQTQLQQAEAQHRAAMKKANDRPMLDQMERIRLVQRVANACLAASNQNGTLRIKLHPESLGSVSVKIKTKNKTMSIELEAETESAKSLLLENADDLKQELQKHGISVEAFSVQVKVGDGESPRLLDQTKQLV